MAAHARHTRFSPVLALVYMTFLAAFVMLGLVAWWLFYPYKVLRVTNARMTLPVVYQGQTTSYSDDYTKFYSIEGKAARAFVDGIVYDAGSYEAALPVGSGHNFREVTIPETLPPGRYHLQITIRYQVNPIRELVYKFVTDEFEVRTQPANPDLEGDKSTDS